MKILAISGSLRERSSNTQVLRAVVKLAPASITVSVEATLESLPFYNPDLDQQGKLPPPAVRALRGRIAAADALLFSSPEYAHGIPGVLKNAIDWLMSASEIAYKPIGVINTAPRSVRAQAALADTLKTMLATLVPEASITLSLSGRKLDAAGIVADAEFSKPLTRALEALAAAAAQYGKLRQSLSSRAIPEAQ